MTGGIGRENLTAFYRDHFIFWYDIVTSSSLTPNINCLLYQQPSRRYTATRFSYGRLRSHCWFVILLYCLRSSCWNAHNCRWICISHHAWLRHWLASPKRPSHRKETFSPYDCHCQCSWRPCIQWFVDFLLMLVFFVEKNFNLENRTYLVGPGYCSTTSWDLAIISSFPRPKRGRTNYTRTPAFACRGRRVCSHASWRIKGEEQRNVQLGMGN